jgi:hypothetical protein
MTLEHRVSVLGEPRPTSVDAFFLGPAKVAVEVKFAEDAFGRCSRPGLTPDKPNYERDHCDGSFAVQRGRTARCSLSERGIRYWQFVPHLFAWSGEQDHHPCPLELTYQLVRNVLAACVGEGETLDAENGHPLVIYDARNPAFHPGGAADVQWWATVRALRYPRLLRRVSWQRMATHLEQFRDLDWLTGGLRSKYGIQPPAYRPFPSLTTDSPTPDPGQPWSLIQERMERVNWPDWIDIPLKGVLGILARTGEAQGAAAD